mgnify:FL=1|jgi:predicted nucleotidyltransferase
MHDADRNQIVTLIQAVVPDVRAVYRFGSSGTGATHAESDLDLAVLPPVPLPAPTRWDLEQDLSIALRRDVDLGPAIRLHGHAHAGGEHRLRSLRV